MSKKIDTEEFISRSNISRGGVNLNNYDKSVYVNNKTKIIVTCPLHGDYLQNPKDHYENKSNCPKCHNSKRSLIASKGLISFKEEGKIKFNDKFDYSKFSYINNKTKGVIICPIHGDFEQVPAEHLSSKYGCPSCARLGQSEWKRHSWEQFLVKAYLRHGLRYVYTKPEEKINSFSIIKITCLKHGSFYQKVYHHLNGSGCSKCLNSGNSKAEIEIIDFIKSFYSGKIIYRHKPDFMNGKELDIYIPEFNFAIEFNGAYWHSEEKKGIHYHYDKWKACNDNGVVLLNVWDFYFNDSIKKQIYFSKIKHFMKMDERIFARKCTTKEVANIDAVHFHKENHLEGIGILYKDSRSYGLFRNDVLVMAITYGLFYNQGAKNFDLKVQRISTKMGVTVVGGVSRLMNLIPRPFIFQVTLDTGGTISSISDFENLTFRYWWVKSEKFLTRNRTQVSILKNNPDWKQDDTEKSYMERKGFLRVYDSGIVTLKKYSQV